MSGGKGFASPTQNFSEAAPRTAYWPFSEPCRRCSRSVPAWPTAGALAFPQPPSSVCPDARPHSSFRVPTGREVPLRPTPLRRVGAAFGRRPCAFALPRAPDMRPPGGGLVPNTRSVSTWVWRAVVWSAGGGGGGWHKALVVGSVSLWRRLLASRPCSFCYDKQASALLRASALPWASPCLGGGGGMQVWIPIKS